MFQTQLVQAELVMLPRSTGLALGMHLAGLQWRVRGVMLAGALSYYHEQQTMLTSAFAANTCQVCNACTLKVASVKVNTEIFLLALSAHLMYIMLRMAQVARGCRRHLPDI